MSESLVRIRRSTLLNARVWKVKSLKVQARVVLVQQNGISITCMEITDSLAAVQRSALISSLVSKLIL